MMMITDGNARIKRINGAMEKYTGVSASRASGMMCGDLIFCGSRLKNGPECGGGKKCPDCGIRQAIEYTFRTGKSVENKTVEFISKKSGKKIKRALLVSTVSIGTKSGRSVLAAFEDITSRKLAENALKKSYRKLRELDSMKTNFISMASHELRTPLTIIKGYTALIKQELAGCGQTGSINEYLKEIETNSKKLDNIIEDILNSSVVRGGTIAVSRARVNAVQLLRNFISAADEQANKKNISLAVEISENYIPVDLDETLFLKALNNIIDNAVKFSEAGSKIIIGMEPVDGSRTSPPSGRTIKIQAPSVLFFVKDYGPGIAVNEQENIFDRFYQADNSIKREHPGMGLGLSTARDIIRAHGGDLWVESRGKGRGAVFFILIPAGKVADK